MIDTHAHLNFEAFRDDWREVTDRAVKSGVNKMIVVGTDLNTSQRAVELAQQHTALYASIGIHPQEALQFSIPKIIPQLRQLIAWKKVVAVGEIGLDKHGWEEDNVDLYRIQRELFKAQIDLAQEFDKAVLIHSWEAKRDALEMLPQGYRGVFHCFEGSKKYLRQILAAGFYVSFTGQITYVPDRLEVAKEVPLERLLLETDSPLTSPYPLRGQRNEPKNVRLIAEAHARSRGISIEELDRVTTENAERLFGLPVG